MKPSEEHPTPLILLIDDVLQNLQVLSESLRQEGFRITGASSGPGAFKLLERVTPDLILCDIMMPEMDGYEVTRKLKANPQTRDIPVIFLTAKSESKDIIKGFEAGGVDYITKPFNTAELQARVRTHLELKQARDTIYQHSQQLETLNHEKDNILNIAAHDLKNPLNSIMLMAEMTQIKQGHLSPEKSLEYATAIYQDANRMLLIISNLLDVNKIENGVIHPQWQPWKIQELLHRLENEHRQRAQAKEIQLHFVMPEETLNLQTDPLLLFQILDNLLSNALKFSEPGQEVWVRATQDKNKQIVLEVEDRGPGFSPEDQQKMYQKFARLSAQPTAGENSTGLGLAIVKRLSDLLKVELSCESEFRQGTCFRLTCPLSITED